MLIEDAQPGSDHVRSDEESGIAAHGGTFKDYKIQFNPDALWKKFQSAPMEVVRDLSPNRAVAVLRQIKEALRGSIPEDPDSTAEKSKIPKLAFAPRPEPADKKTDEIINNPDQTQHRVAICGQFADVLRQSKEAHSDSYEEDFQSALALAEHSYGEQSASIFAELLTLVEKNQPSIKIYSKTDDKLKDLSFSLLRSGYKSEGHELLAYFVDRELPKMSLSKLGDLLIATTEFNQLQIGNKILTELQTRAVNMKNSFQDVLVAWYASFECTFTARGEAIVAEFFTSEPDRVKTAKQFHQVVLSLYESGDYLASPSGVSFNLASPPLGAEASYYEQLVNLAVVGRSISEAEVLLKNKSPQLAQIFNETAKSMYSLSMFGAEQKFRVRYEQWERDIPDLSYQKSTGMFHFIDQLEKHPRTVKNHDFDFSSDAFSEISSVLRAIFSDAEHFTEGLHHLYATDDGIEKVSLFQFASERLPKNISDSELAEFISEWKKSVTAACEHLKVKDYFENRLDIRDFKMTQSLDRIARPPDSKTTHFYCNQMTQIAHACFKRGTSEYRQLGLELLQELPESTENFFNPHRYDTQSDFFGTPELRPLHRLTKFQPAFFKATALITNSTFLPEYASELVHQADELLDVLVINPEIDDYQYIECRIITMMQLLEKYVQSKDSDSALRVYEQLGTLLNRTEDAFKKKLQDYLSMPIHNRHDDDWSMQSKLEENLSHIKFWQQDYGSRIKSQLAVGLAADGQIERAVQLVEDLRANFLKDINGRRNRFDPLSIISSANAIAESPQLKDFGFPLFKISIRKLALSRGHKNSDSDPVSYFSESVQDSSLSIDEKDQLLFELVNCFTPPRNINFIQMSNSIEGLLSVADDIKGNQKYPKTESEILKVMSNIVADFQYDRQNESAYISIMPHLRQQFVEILEKHPEIAFGSNFAKLASLSERDDHKQNVSALLPFETRSTYAHTPDSSGGLSIDRIRSGFGDIDETYEEARTLLLDVLSSPQKIKENLDHILLVYSALIKQELTKFRNKNDQKHRVMIQEIMGLRGVKDLLEVAEQHRGEGELSDEVFRIYKSLLFADSSEESKGKLPLYELIIGNIDYPVSIQRLAFSNFAKSNAVSTYVKYHFDKKVTEQSDDEQQKFYGWIKELLIINDQKLPADALLSFIFENPLRADDFIKKYRDTKDAAIMPNSTPISDPDYSRRNNFDTFYNGSPDHFFSMRDEWIESKGLWIPNMFDEAELLLLFKKSYFKDFDEFIGGIGQIYLNKSFRIDGLNDNKYTYTIDQVELELKKYLPSFGLSDEQKAAVGRQFDKNFADIQPSVNPKAVQSGRGTLSFFQLEGIVGELKLSATDRNKFLIFLRGSGDQDSLFLMGTFGRDVLNEIEKKKLEVVLRNSQLNFSRRNELIYSFHNEYPKVFEQMPDIVKFMLQRFFEQLPFGERQAIVSEFDQGDTLPPEKAIKRFFEVTGTEKIGQFLSTRHDIVPESYRHELEEFQENVQSGSFDEAKRTIERELKKPINEVFSSLEERPMKVGTIGDVYGATLVDGTKVVVKVISPSKRELMRISLHRLQKVCSDLAKNLDRFSGNYDPSSLYEEYKDSIDEELDFRVELRNAEEVRRDLPKDITIPRYFQELCGESVLVQSLATGEHINSLSSNEAKKNVLDRLGSMLMDQILVTGVFHDDLHPGNIRVQPENSGIELLDFGRTGYATELERKNVMPLIMAMITKSADGIIQSLQSSKDTSKSFDKIGLKNSLTAVLSESDLSFSTKLSKIIFQCGAHGLEVSSVFLRMLKAVMTFEGTAIQLDPTFKLEAFIQKFGLKKLFANFNFLSSK